MQRSRTWPRAFALVVALAGAAVLPGAAPDARASVSVAVSWEGLLGQSTAAAVLTALDARSVWEGGRIYTYTRMRVDQAMAGELSQGAEAEVRTMGGIVGDIGQQVEGEAVLTPGRSSLLFLHRGSTGAFEVTARGQGQFPVVSTDPAQPARVVRSRAAGLVIPANLPTPALPPRLAADVLHGRTLADAQSAVTAAWAVTHTH
jgi:hypothetical protein